MSLKIAALLSGNGTTLQNILDRIRSGALDAEVVCVVSSRADAFGLERAKRVRIPAAAVVRKDYEDTDSFSEAIWKEVERHDPGLIVLAGFMSLLRVPEDFVNKIMNVHPALIPAFCGKGMYGRHVHEAVIASGAKITGVTVHFVDDEYDHGPIILQRAVEVRDDDTPDTLADRVQAAEREAYPAAIRLYAEGRLRVKNGRVRIA